MGTQSYGGAIDDCPIPIPNDESSDGGWSDGHLCRDRSIENARRPDDGRFRSIRVDPRPHSAGIIHQCYRIVAAGPFDSVIQLVRQLFVV